MRGTRLFGFGTSMLAVAFAALPVQADPVTLRVGDYLPTTHPLSVEGIQLFMSEVTKRSNGEVVFEHFPAQQLGKAAEMLGLVQSGVLDLGLVASGYVADKMPLYGMMELPGTFQSSCEGTQILNRLVAPDGWLTEAEFAPNNIHALFSFTTTPYQIFFRDKGIESLSAMAGLKVGTQGGLGNKTVEGMKGVPMMFTAPEVYESLSRGTIDSFIFGASATVSYDLDDLIGSATRDANFGGSANSLVISAQAWDALPETSRAVLAEVGAEVAGHACGVIDDLSNKVYENEFAASGATIVAVTDEDRALQQSVFDAMGAEWAASLASRNLDGEAALAALEAASSAQ